MSTAAEFLKRYLRRKQALPPEPAPELAEQLHEAVPPLKIRLKAREAGELWSTLQLIKISVAANIVLAGLLLVTAKMSRNAPVQEIRTQGDLREQIRAHFAETAVQNIVIKDPLISFLILSLTVKHALTPEGAPYLTLLQGLMTSDLYQDAAAAIERNVHVVQSYGISESLVVEGVSDLDYDAQLQRTSAVVSGHVLIQAIRTAAGKPLAISRPYRALVVLDVLPASRLNPYGYFITSLEEAQSEQDVRRFDQRQDARRARANGRTR